jgi:hypothetical protein
LGTLLASNQARHNRRKGRTDFFGQAGRGERRFPAAVDAPRVEHCISSKNTGCLAHDNFLLRTQLYFKVGSEVEVFSVVHTLIGEGVAASYTLQGYTRPCYGVPLQPTVASTKVAEDVMEAY